jgi:2-polyprenyl-3-methyl-5-hydroxy-6-metoxy-1,4-benzoquinol methylase
MDGVRNISFGDPSISWFGKKWNRALCESAYYKFAAKMIGKGKRVLEIGCGEGFGTWILAKECGFAKGIDSNQKDITTATANWENTCADFECVELFDMAPQAWNAVVWFERHGRLPPSCFWNALKRNLAHDGIAVIGTWGNSRFEKPLSRHFTHLFKFAAQDGMVLAGSSGSANGVIFLGCRKK